MRRNALALLVFASILLLLPSGCVKRVWDAPGLPPGSSMAVGSEMRVETFEVDDLEVRVFRIPISESNNRRYQFTVLKQGIKDRDFTLERMEEGVWGLLEIRSDGITITRKTYQTEPAYSTLKADVIELIQGG